MKENAEQWTNNNFHSNVFKDFANHWFFFNHCIFPDKRPIEKSEYWFLTLMLLVANLANTKWCKTREIWLKPWHMGIHMRVLSESYPMNTILVLWTKVASALEGIKEHAVSCRTWPDVGGVGWGSDIMFILTSTLHRQIIVIWSLVDITWSGIFVFLCLISRQYQQKFASPFRHLVMHHACVTSTNLVYDTMLLINSVCVTSILDTCLVLIMFIVCIPLS